MDPNEARCCGDCVTALSGRRLCGTAAKGFPVQRLRASDTPRPRVCSPPRLAWPTLVRAPAERAPRLPPRLLLACRTPPPLLRRWLTAFVHSQARTSASSSRQPATALLQPGCALASLQCTDKRPLPAGRLRDPQAAEGTRLRPAELPCSGGAGLRQAGSVPWRQGPILAPTLSPCADAGCSCRFTPASAPPRPSRPSGRAATPAPVRHRRRRAAGFSSFQAAH